jgi:hypothetical protein
MVLTSLHRVCLHHYTESTNSTCYTLKISIKLIAEVLMNTSVPLQHTERATKGSRDQEIKNFKNLSRFMIHRQANSCRQKPTLVATPVIRTQFLSLARDYYLFILVSPENLRCKDG